MQLLLSGATKKRKVDDLDDQVTLSKMSDRISALPDEILCSVLSFMTLRDSIRTRILAARWRYLGDFRSVLHFDDLNVFGDGSTTKCKSKFVRAVDQFLRDWKCWNNIHGVKIGCFLGNEYASHIDRWVQCFIRMGIIELSLSLFPGMDEKYVLSSSLLDSGDTSYLKCLSVQNCGFTFSSGCTSWIRRLTTLELCRIRLKKEEMEFIQANGLNLTSLSLSVCRWSSSLEVELPGLKKLFLYDYVDEIILNCPNLEILHCMGEKGNFKCSQMPLLREVYISLNNHPERSSLIFAGLTRQAPKLQELTLWVMAVVQPLSATNIISCLKRLDVKALVPIGFDLCSIIHFVNACPLLELLHLKFCECDYTEQSPQREYPDCPCFQLKEVIFDGFRLISNDMELARYLLRNAVALQRMVFKEVHDDSVWRQEFAATLLHDIKTTAQLVFL